MTSTEGLTPTCAAALGLLYESPSTLVQQEAWGQSLSTFPGQDTLIEHSYLYKSQLYV